MTKPKKNKKEKLGLMPHAPLEQGFWEAKSLPEEAQHFPARTLDFPVCNWLKPSVFANS